MYRHLLALVAAVAIASPLLAAEVPAVVCNVKVVSDKVADVSSLEAWKKSTLKDSMSDQDKAIAIWKSVVAHVYDTSPPQEYLNWENGVDDPIKVYNVYGYALCNDIATITCSLARYSGYKAQGWSILGHNTADIWYDNAWHYLDPAFVGYFPKADGTLASTDEIFESVKRWYEENPGYKGDENMAKRKAFQKNEGWKKGPELMRNCPTYDKDGNLPHYGHSWASDMREFDGKTKFIYETGYTNGYRVNIQLRRGEKLTRNWSNKGLHVNQLGGKGGKPSILDTKVGEKELKHTPQYGDLANGRIGNGTLEYAVLADTGLEESALTFDNLKRGLPVTVRQRTVYGDPITVADATKPATLIIRMPSSYVYLSGELAFYAYAGNGGSIAISLSDNNGLDWKEVATIDKNGHQKIDLKKFVGRRYDYRLKFVLTGENTTLDELKLTHDIQHAQRPLPALDKGDNTINFSAGPQESTLTIDGSTTAANKEFQLTLADFHPTIDNMDAAAGLKMTAEKGAITFPIETPGEMSGLRISTFYRANSAKDSYAIEASFDNGASWKPIATLAGKHRFMGDYSIFTDIPKGATKALVRYTGNKADTLLIFNLRIDADYRPANAAFAPIKITYLYEENGAEKKSEHIATKPEASYTLHCDSKPTMKSIILERAN
jgi:hypothetical protein